MKMKLYIIMLFCLMVGMYSCYDDDTTSGRKEVSLLTITAAHDTLTTSFGEERGKEVQGPLQLLSGPQPGAVHQPSSQSQCF